MMKHWSYYLNILLIIGLVVVVQYYEDQLYQLRCVEPVSVDSTLIYKIDSLQAQLALEKQKYDSLIKVKPTVSIRYVEKRYTLSQMDSILRRFIEHGSR